MFGVVYGSGTAKVIIEDSEFLDNYSDTGGALFLQQNSELTVKNSSFKRNKVKHMGGVMFYISLNSFTYDNCVF